MSDRFWIVKDFFVKEERRVTSLVGGDPVTNITSVYLTIEIENVWTFLPNSDLHKISWETPGTSPNRELRNVLVMSVRIPSKGSSAVSIDAQLVRVDNQGYDMGSLENLMRYLRMGENINVRIEEQ